MCTVRGDLAVEEAPVKLSARFLAELFLDERHQAAVNLPLQACRLPAWRGGDRYIRAARNGHFDTTLNRGSTFLTAQVWTSPAGDWRMGLLASLPERFLPGRDSRRYQGAIILGNADAFKRVTVRLSFMARSLWARDHLLREVLDALIGCPLAGKLVQCDFTLVIRPNPVGKERVMPGGKPLAPRGPVRVRWRRRGGGLSDDLSVSAGPRQSHRPNAMVKARKAVRFIAELLTGPLFGPLKVKGRGIRAIPSHVSGNPVLRGVRCIEQPFD